MTKNKYNVDQVNNNELIYKRVQYKRHKMRKRRWSIAANPIISISNTHGDPLGVRPWNVAAAIESPHEPSSDILTWLYADR